MGILYYTVTDPITAMGVAYTLGLYLFIIFTRGEREKILFFKRCFHFVKVKSFVFLIFPDISVSVTRSSIQEISNGLCKFSPTSKKGKWKFVLQTFVLSFMPIIILIIQNSLTFYDTIGWKNDIIAKDILVGECKMLSNVILSLQRERAQISLAVFLDAKSGKSTNLSREYTNTDNAINALRWKIYGTEKIFRNKLRFQIRIDDFR